MERNLIQVDQRRIADGERLYIMLSFGARNVPSKASEYSLDLGPRIIVNSPERAVIERKENQLFKEIQDSKGISKQDMLKMLLGR